MRTRRRRDAAVERSEAEHLIGAACAPLEHPERAPRRDMGYIPYPEPAGEKFCVPPLERARVEAVDVPEGLLRPGKRPELHRQVFDDNAHMQVLLQDRRVVVLMPGLDEELAAVHLEHAAPHRVVAMRGKVEVDEKSLWVVRNDTELVRRGAEYQSRLSRRGV